MGDGADNIGDGQPQPSGWGPEEPVYQHGNYVPQYQQPQYVQQPQFVQPQYPTPAAPPRAPRRSRRSSKVETRLRMVQCFEELLSTPVFDDPNDPYAAAVQDEIAAFAQRRIDELFGEPSKADATSLGFSPEEAAALKVLAQKMMAPDEEGAAADDPAPAAPVAPVAPRPPPPAPVRGPRGCANPGCQFPPHAPEHPCSNVRPPAPPVQRQPQPVPAPQPPPEAPEATEGPRVVQRPTLAQRQALEAARQQRAMAPAPVQQPPPQQRMAPPPPQGAPRATRRGKRGQPQPAPVPVAVGPPPPRRYAMPQGAHMTMVTGQKAEEAIAAGGTVMSETFVRAPRS